MDVKAPVMPPLVVTVDISHKDSLFDHVKQNAKHATRMLAPLPGQSAGKSVVICGAGYSLRDFVQHPVPADEIWACNSAVRYLKNQGVRVTHAIGIDQSEGMLEDWVSVYPDVEYYIASSVHPDLVAHLQAHNAKLTWFHNFLGLHDPAGWMPPDVCMVCQGTRRAHRKGHRPHKFVGVSYEMWLYKTLYGDTVRPAYGLNVVVRAIEVANNMGFNPIRVYGADCACAPDQPPMPSVDAPEYEAWAAQAIVYADGRTVQDAYGLQGLVAEAGGRAFHGRRWHTRADMLISARHLVDIVRHYPHVELMGDTLPNAMMDFTEEDWRGVPNMDGKGGITGFRMHPSQVALLAAR